MPKGMCVPIFSIIGQKMQKLKKLPKLAPKYPKKAPKSKINQTYKLRMAKRRYVPIFSKIAQKM